MPMVVVLFTYLFLIDMKHKALFLIN